MSAEDQQAVALHAADIALAASIYGYTLDASWSYRQAVCPLAPGHLLLDYSNNSNNSSNQRGSSNDDGSNTQGAANGGPGTSRFSAVVPRNGRVVRIIPLLRAGTAPFVTPVGAHSYAVFNAIMDAEPGLRQRSIDPASGAVFDWGLCYLALVSGPPAAVSDPDRELHLVSAVEPTLKLLANGAVGIALTIQEDSRTVAVWDLAFSRSGALLNAVRVPHAINWDLNEAAHGPAVASDPQPPRRSGDVTEKPGPRPLAAQSIPGEGPVAEPRPASPASATRVPAAPTALQEPPERAPSQPPQPTQDAAGGPAVSPPASPAEDTQLEGRPVPEGPVPTGRPVPESPAPVGRPVPQA